MASARSVNRRKPGPPTPDGWKAKYVELIARRGNYFETAELCGIDYRTALRQRDRDPAFDDACRQARELFADKLEHRMLDSAEESGNPAGFIVRLKALRPLEYIEKHAIMNVSANLSELPLDDAQALLRAMLGSTTPSTQHMLTQGDTDASAAPDS